MTPQEKAEELFDKFYLVKDERGLCRLNEFIAKQCAIIAVDEILKAVKKDSDFTITYELAKQYYQQVKLEIENL
jgi:hypothetical protein